MGTCAKMMVLLLLTLLLACVGGAASQAAVVLNAEAPLLLAFDIQPGRVNTGIGPKQVLISAYLLDADQGTSGVGDIQIQFRSPSGSHVVSATFYHQVAGQPEALVEGDVYQGLWQVALVLPKQAEEGIWELEYFFLVDQAGNYQVLTSQDMHAFGFASTIAVQNTTVAIDLPLVLSAWSKTTPPPTPSPSPTIPINMPPIPPF